MVDSRIVVSLFLAITVVAGASKSAQAADLRRSSARSTVDQAPSVRAIDPSDDVELFRRDLLRMIDELEKALDSAARNPVVGPEVTRILIAGGLALPFPKSVREPIETASIEELARTKQSFTAYPVMLEVPAVINEALEKLDTNEQRGRLADLCSTNYDAFEGFKSNRSTIKGLTRTNDILGVTLRLTNMAKNLVGAITEDTPYVGRIPAIGLITLAGLQDIAINVISVISSSFVTAKDVNELSIAACCVDPGPSQSLFGRGCDNRDNNCAGGTDEPAEDLYAPSLEVDTSALGRCYTSGDEAREALEFAVTATDDCSEVSPLIQITVATGICTGFATLQVRDAAGNTTSEGPLELTVDSQPPTLSVSQLNACYATIAEARNDFQRVGVTDCTDVLVDIDTSSAECAAQLSLSAVDECGNRAEYLAEAVVDGAPPQVDVRKLLLPSVGGKFCFDSPASAVSAVENVVTISDNCTPENDLDISTTTTGPACAMTVTTSAIDGCGLVGVDVLPVRIDDTPPVVTCSVATPTLWPPDGTMRDVGFTMSVSDDCDTPDDIEIEVTATSDEPTALARRTLGGDDPYPDAQLVRGANGDVETILLRAERTDYGPADGRVYRVRVVATDGCGQVGEADCWVDVPREINSGQGVNSGQQYRADRQN